MSVLRRRSYVRASTADSPTYELDVPYFSSGSCEEWLLFRKNVDKVLTGQNVTTGPGKFNVARRLLDGDALATFNNALGEQNQTVAIFEKCMDAVRDQIFPARAVLLQKRYMRRYLRKKRECSTKEFVARLSEMNSYLPLFPPIEDGGAAPSKLEDDEILDLLEFGVPNSWQRNMILQDFDPLRNSIKDFVSFCERLEQVEVHEGNGNQAPKKKKSEKSSQRPSEKRKKRGREESDDSKYCMLHGEGSHDTSDCFTLKAQAKRMKGQYEAQTPEGKKKLKAKHELHALVEAQVEKALKEQKKAKYQRKRKMEELEARLEKTQISDTSSETESSSDDD
jgi:hypothetical protein